jgi:hypothetical protein
VQAVYEDPRRSIVYDWDAVEQVYIHTISSRAWEARFPSQE